MIVERLPELLRWNCHPAQYDDVHDSYVELLATRLAQLCSRLAQVDAPLAGALAAVPARVKEDGLLRVLTAPESSFRLLFAGALNDREVARFLLEAVIAERVREGEQPDCAQPPWTALGDARFPTPAGRDPGSDRLPPLDFGSPYAAGVDLSGRDRASVPPRRPFSAAEQRRVLLLLEQAIDQVERTRGSIAGFVRRFNKVVILQKDSEAPGLFASGSNGHYVGRTFLANPHLGDPACIADALVHEGIHGLLYMSEQLEPWYLDPAARTSPRMQSPWTGSMLTLPSFLQACFVWFGLLNFWSNAWTSEAAEREVTLKFMSRSLRGFFRGTLRKQLAQAAPMIHPELLGAVDEVQEIVRQAYAAAA